MLLVKHLHFLNGDIELHGTVRLLVLIVFVLGATTACAGFILFLLK